MNLSCYWSCLHHRLCNMHTICCLHYVVENLEGNIKMTKYVVEWYNSIGLFNKQAYIVPVNPIVIIFYHQQYRICPLKQSLFGWFTYRGFLTATCWNNPNVRVESKAGKTVHKLFVGGVCIFYLATTCYSLKTTGGNGDNSTSDFSIVIQIWWKLPSALILVVPNKSLRNFACNGITLKPNFLQILIMIAKLMVKWAPGKILILIAIISRMHEWNNLNLAWWFMLGMNFIDEVYQISGLWPTSWEGMDGVAWNLERYYGNMQYRCIYIYREGMNSLWQY